MSLELRLADQSDCRYLYNLRNHPTVRAASRNTEEIPYDMHVSWFKKTLENPDRALYIGIDNEKRVAQVRFDKEGEGIAEISVGVAPEKHSSGYGTAVIVTGSKTYFDENPDISLIRAEIMPNNLASIIVFEKAGYQPVGRTTEGMLEYHLTRDREN